jgi:hypothetical protein
MNALANAHSNIIGYAVTYTWDAIESVAGNYANNASTPFGNIIADFNYLQSVRPGAHFIIVINPAVFGNYGTNINQTVNGNGVPDYILASSAYGPVGNNGTQYGYQLYIAGGVDGGEIEAVYAAIWRPSVMNRLAALFQALAATSFTTTSGPYAGKTFTFDTHPLIEAIITGEDEFAGPFNDYTSTGLLSASATNLYPAVVAAFPHTTFGYSWDYLAGDTGGQTVTAMQQAYAARVAFTGPDIYASGRREAAQIIYAGGSWNGSAYITTGGTNYARLMPYVGQVQSTNYGKPISGGSPSTPAEIFSNIQSLGSSYAVWTMAGEIAPYNPYSESGFYTEYIKPLADATPTFNTTCPTAYVAVGGCNTMGFGCLALALVRRRKARVGALPVAAANDDERALVA